MSGEGLSYTRIPEACGLLSLLDMGFDSEQAPVKKPRCCHEQYQIFHLIDSNEGESPC